ncbi:DUF885 domain-containing protein [Echinimonas agarilytica]|uniref:DUF885 domain-containing protein n=1 Tax=Echinimonas agarilytica TaxID=1215918 RepID=A0AA41W557_9GAMM|nr:DUF885 domain-containing protein [Echinimonas agarilytica]MCM2679023.1 DUF885 domain-containing protein [Echinimonas agarilytica]
MKHSLLAISIGLFLAGCSQEQTTESTPAQTTQSAVTSEVTAAAEQQSNSDIANALYDDMFMTFVGLSPMSQSYLGITDNQDKWDDLSEAMADKKQQLNIEYLEKVKALNTDGFDAQDVLSHRLAISTLQNDIDDYKWRFHSYPVNQMYGLHSQVPALLINQQQVSSVDDAGDYIARLNGIPALFDQLKVNLDTRAEKGIIVPKFVFPHVINDSENLLVGAPFDGSEAPSTLLADFTTKVNALDATDDQKILLITEANKALLTSVKPAYESLVDYLKELEKKADSRDGAWKFPNGADFYKNALARTTTTDLTAEQIHQLGLDNVARIHDEMKTIMTKVGFKGSLQEFFVFMRDDPQFYYDDTDEGRAAYLAKATALIDTMKGQLDSLFTVKPKADLTVKAVEAFREKSAGKAFYQRPSMDGSRPGIYYANLYKMEDMPTYQMEALAYHEGIPGHHMQLAISNELEGIPKFRKFGRYTAYSEGWGLYSEFIPKEIGFYEDPYSDFGRLAMELWRACRLVVDTGLHHYQWSREQAIDYLLHNTPNAQNDSRKAIERYIVMPSQATAYLIGKIQILEMREKARAELGEKFDIRGFHDTVLESGPLPLDVLQQQVDAWVASKK